MIFSTETEYSRLWIEKNPVLFASSFLQFLDDHPMDAWKLSINRTAGFVTIKATKI
jgi:hypothetical protein